MSIMGSIQPAETSETHPEMVERLCDFFRVSAEVKDKVLEEVDLVVDYFTTRGSLTLAATRSIIETEKEQDTSLAEFELKVFRSTELPQYARKFVDNEGVIQGWITSHFIPHNSQLHPHQMPIFVEKMGNEIICTIFDRRINWEKIRASLMEGFLDQDKCIRFYLSTERRQYDWSTCSLLSLDDLKKLFKMDRKKIYEFFDGNYTSREVARNKKWSLTVCEHLPARFMELVQSAEDFAVYHKWALGKDIIDQEQLRKVSEEVFRHLIGGTKKINNTIMERFRHVVCEVIFPRILNKSHPPGCLHAQTV